METSSWLDEQREKWSEENRKRWEREESERRRPQLQKNLQALMSKAPDQRADLQSTIQNENSVDRLQSWLDLAIQSSLDEAIQEMLAGSD